MPSSQGIYDMAQRFAESIRRNDIDALSALIAIDEDVLFIGTDATEWWTGHDTIVSLYREQLHEMGIEGIGLADFDVVAHELGDGGWFAGTTAFLAGGDRVPVRISGAARRDAGEWRIAHLHVSRGVPDDRVY